LLDTCEKLIKTINQTLSDNERRFILSVKKGKPNYLLMPFKHLEEFPALKWKLINIKNMDKEKHKNMFNKLTEALEV